MRRIILMLTVAALMVALMALSAVPAAAIERDEILEKIREITADRLGVDEGDVTPEASFTEEEEGQEPWEEPWQDIRDLDVFDRAYDIEPDELREEFIGKSPSTG